MLKFLVIQKFKPFVGNVPNPTLSPWPRNGFCQQRICLSHHNQQLHIEPLGWNHKNNSFTPCKLCLLIFGWGGVLKKKKKKKKLVAEVLQSHANKCQQVGGRVVN
jgi:hypothetical protein